MDTARTPKTTCHGKVSRRSVFFGLLSQLFFIRISLAYALVRLFFWCAGKDIGLRTTFQASLIRPSNEASR
jgi:hypothetical protein